MSIHFRLNKLVQEVNQSEYSASSFSLKKENITHTSSIYSVSLLKLMLLTLS